VTRSGSAAGFGGHAPGQRGPAAPQPAASEPGALPVTTALPREEAVVAIDWRPFLRAMAAEIDAVAGSAGRDALLHGVGLQLARMYPLPVRESLDGLAMEMTETLDGFGWGSVGIAFSDREKCLLLTHRRLPRVGGAGDPPGSWLAGVLVGLYEGWMSQQPGTDASLVARRVASAQPDEIAIRYGKE
jgi:Cellulose synthase subunit D